MSNIENLTGSAFDDTLTGNSGNNVLRGEAGADRMIGGTGNDTYYVDNSGDVVVEYSTGGTSDKVFSSVSFSLSGAYVETLTLTGSGNISATGNNQDNILTGNGGNNVIQGNGGNDTINGGLGADTLTGGAGSDLFAFSSALGGGNIDAITDYTVANDTIQLDDSVFAGLALGALSAGAFYIGTAAHDSTDRIIYNSSTGALLFDADGNGAGAAVQFATLSTGLALVASEFVVV
ncbi:calcium-binding protein [Sphingobium scionense]